MTQTDYLQGRITKKSAIKKHCAAGEASAVSDDREMSPRHVKEFAGFKRLVQNQIAAVPMPAYAEAPLPGDHSWFIASFKTMKCAISVFVVAETSVKYVCMYRFRTLPHPHGHWYLQELLWKNYVGIHPDN